jgi:hypothetical protein
LFDLAARPDRRLGGRLEIRSKFNAIPRDDLDPQTGLGLLGKPGSKVNGDRFRR